MTEMLEQLISFRPRKRPLLVYILGWGRSGSTILANVLGSLDGATSVGELVYLWRRGVGENGLCGCGRSFGDCAFWQTVSFGTRPLNDISRVEARQIDRRFGHRARHRQLFALMQEKSRHDYLTGNRAALEDLRALYKSILYRSRSDVLIDASKSPFFAVNLLAPQDDIDVVFLHLIRDPRAVLHSWKKVKERLDNSENQLFPRYSSLRSVSQWTVVNVLCERFQQLAPDRYFQVRYERFAENWRIALAETLPHLVQQSFMFDDRPPTNNAIVTPQHSISGNPARFDQGKVSITEDLAWKSALSGYDARLAGLVCKRAAERYGYRF